MRAIQRPRNIHQIFKLTGSQKPYPYPLESMKKQWQYRNNKRKRKIEGKNKNVATAYRCSLSRTIHTNFSKLKRIQLKDESQIIIIARITDCSLYTLYTVQPHNQHLFIQNYFSLFSFHSFQWPFQLPQYPLIFNLFLFLVYVSCRI